MNNRSFEAIGGPLVGSSGHTAVSRIPIARFTRSPSSSRCQMAVDVAAPVSRILNAVTPISIPRPVRAAVRRLLGALLVIWGVVTLTFLITRVFSGDPVDLFTQ